MIETDIVKGMFFKGERSGLLMNLTMSVSPGYKLNSKFDGGVQWYMMDTNDFISNINLKLKKEIGNIESFNGLSISFRLSNKEI